MKKITITPEQLETIVEEGLFTLYNWEECYSTELSENFVLYLN